MINITGNMRELADKCFEVKTMKDQLDAQYKTLKSALELECKNNCIAEFETEITSVKITESRRFKAYSDDETVLRLIPFQHHKECTSLNKKKIDALIKKGVLPNSIKDEEKFTRVTTTKFTKVE